MARQTLLLALALCQSNELGSGETPDMVRGLGGPYRDATLRSMWPRVAELLGRSGVWLTVSNTAIGSTSAADSWVGRCRAWVNGMTVATGSYVTNAGNLFRCSNAQSFVAASTVAPAAGTGADTVTWSLVGAVQAGDTDGAVYSEGSPRFDPNGYMAAALAPLTHAAAAGYDRKAVLFSIGQGDKTVSTTRAQYAAALVAGANYFTSRGITVYIGFTCRAATAGADAWYDAHLDPGWADALAQLAGNRLVKTGANLYRALGLLPVTPAVGLPGLKADSLHMNDVALGLAADAWAPMLLL